MVFTSKQAIRIRINNRIRVPQVRLVGADGKQLGVVPIAHALREAEDAHLDLVEVAPNVKPPVCKIMDFSKFKYEQEKKDREARKKQHIVHVKEVKFSPKIGEHDYQTKIGHLKKFLARKDRAKVSMYFRGREMAHIDIGRNIINKVIKDLADFGEPEGMPKMEGKLLLVRFKPKT